MIPGRSSLVAQSSKGMAPTSAGSPVKYWNQSCNNNVHQSPVALADQALLQAVLKITSLPNFSQEPMPLTG